MYRQPSLLLADNNLTDITGTIGPDEETISSEPGPAVGSYPGDFLLNQGNLQATYTFVGGEITDAAKDPEGKWKGLDFDPETRTWVESTP